MSKILNKMKDILLETGQLDGKLFLIDVTAFKI